MKIKWLGHACFLVTGQGGIRILIDPYATSSDLGYLPLRETADLVLVTHNHFDHNNVISVLGQPEVVRRPGHQVVKGITVKGTQAYHDEAGGKQRGGDVLFSFDLDGIAVCHLGDLGHVLTPEQVTEVGGVDILLVPVGGTYTIDAGQATKICEQLKPRIAIPMHYKTAKVKMPLATVDAFTRGKTRVRMIQSSEIDIDARTLPEPTEIVVLEPAN
jgi:L-ascorbate metabolism protein UlaG (beta-lactamase superfamily)